MAEYFFGLIAKVIISASDFSYKIMDARVQQGQHSLSLNTESIRGVPWGFIGWVSSHCQGAGQAVEQLGEPQGQCIEHLPGDGDRDRMVPAYRLSPSQQDPR